MQNPLSRLSTALARGGQSINEKRPSSMDFFLSNNETKYSVYFSPSQLKNRHWLLIAIAVLLLSACTTPQVTRSGQAKSYQGLQKIGEHGMGIPPQAARGGHYAQVLVAPLQVTAAVARQVTPEVALEVERTLRQSLEAELSRSFMLAPRNPGTDTLIVRTRITRVAEASPVINAMTTLLLGPVKNGGLSVEFEAVDGRSGQQQALLLLADDAGFADILDSYQRAAHAQALARRFAGEAAGFFSPLGRAAR